MVILDKAGRFITGICHPKNRIDLIKQAGMGWVRMDVPFPFEAVKKNGLGGNKNGNFNGDSSGYNSGNVLSERYITFRERCKSLAENGLRAMCITPYPSAFTRYGADPSSADWLDIVKGVCKFMAKDLEPYNVGWQVTNEMYVFHFRVPLTPEQTIPFLAAGLQGVREGAPGAILGHNSVTAGGTEYDQSVIKGLKQYEPMMDYIGLDTYKGTWADGETDDIIGDINRTYELTGMPVLVQEFGFASTGLIFEKQEVLDYLNARGYDSPEAVIESPKSFLDRIPYYIANRIMQSPETDWGKNALASMPHILKKWPGGSKIFRHTPEGQAAFYDNLLGGMINNPHVCGTVVYCWSDDAQCFGCHTADCPCETAWGLTYNNETQKPAYAVVKKHFTGI